MKQYKVYTVDFRYRFGCDTQVHSTGTSVGSNMKEAKELFARKNWGRNHLNYM